MNRTIYLPDDLAKQIGLRGPDFNVSAICQAAVRKALETATGRCSRCGQPLPAGWKQDNEVNV